MKIVFNIKEDDARNPGVIADCVGDNAGDSVGPSADGFETYGVTGVALISFILLAVPDPQVQVQLLVWIFVMRIAMIIASGLSYFVNESIAKGRYLDAPRMNFEAPLTSLVWLTSAISVAITYVVSYLLVPDLGDGTLWWKLSTVITCGTLAGAIIPEFVKVFTSTESTHVREVVTSSREGGASLNILSGFVAGNFSAYWLGLSIVVLMSIAYYVSLAGLGVLMVAPSVFAFGLVAFGFLGMGPVTIAVDSYGPVTDNAQSIFELSVIESLPGIKESLKSEHGFDVNFERAKDLLEENDGAGNTFKATAKPVLIGTAVVGATTMIFSIIVLLTGGLTHDIEKLSILHPPFLLGLITGGAVIYWFTGASAQAVTTGAYRAVEFIKANIRLDGVEKASVSDSKRVVEICTQYAQRGMFNIFLTVFFSTLAFAFYEPFFFIGSLISIALFGLYQAIFMANAGGAWDNAKKIVEVELKAKGTPLHAATVVGDTVGDPFKDTSSVALNPVIKFTTLFGLLAVELAVSMSAQQGTAVTQGLAAAFLAVSMFFVWRSFYGVPLGWREALRITRRVAEALHYAHSQQVVHRDITPANIMLLPCGDPKILDFGIAKMEARSNLTTACQVFGTPLFMAPEQALGKKPDGRADLFSLGAIAYTLLTGRLAFEAPSIPATVRRVVNDDPEPPSRIVPDLPQGVDEIIARVLAKSPKDRYSCGRALAEDIQTLLDAPRTRRGQLALGLAGDAPPTHSIVDVDAELAALVSSPAAPADSVPATSPRGTPRPLRFVLPALLAVLSVCYLALHGPAAEGPAAPASAPLSQPAAADPARAEGPGTATPSSAAADDPPSQVSVRPLGSASTLRNNRSLGEPARPRPTPVSLLPKRRTPGPASTSNNRLSTSEPARVRIDFEHPLRSGKLRLWIDEEMVLQQELEGREATKVLKLRKGRIGREIAVKPGERTVRVQVRWDDNEREQSLSGKFESGAARQLDLKLGRFRKNLSAEWK
jgi:Na+/H+-translocating membrane pyrophosphatase/serine/threonine protein kinase